MGTSDSSDSSEQGAPPDAADDQEWCIGEGRWVAGGAPVQGRKKTPKPFAKGEIIDLTKDNDDEEEEAGMPTATEPPAQQPKKFRRTYTLDEDSIDLIKKLPSPKSKEDMIKHDIMSEVNPRLVRKIILEEQWDMLSIPPSRNQYVPINSPFTFGKRPKYALSAMHPRGSLGQNMLSAEERLDRYYDAVAEGDPYAEKALAQMYAAANENQALPGQLGKRRREEPVVEEQEVGARRLQVERDTDVEAPPAKKTLLGSHRNTKTVGLKAKAKMAISSLVHGSTSRPAGLFIKPRSKAPKTALRASESVSGQTEDNRNAGLETSQQIPPNPPPPMSPVISKRAAPVLSNTPSPQMAQYSQERAPNLPWVSREIYNVAAPILPMTSPSQNGQYSQQRPQNPPAISPEVYTIAAPILPKTPSPRKPKHSQRPRDTGRVHKPSQSKKKSKDLNAMRSKGKESESSKRFSASLERQLQDTATDSWDQCSVLEPGMSGGDKSDNKAKKVRATKTKGSGITDSVRRSDRISKKGSAGVKY